MQSEIFHARLTDGSVGSHLVKLSVPMLFNILMIVAFNLTDTYFIAQLGTSELAAMSLTFPVVATLASLTMGLGDGAGAAVAIAIGEGDRQKVRQLTTSGLLLSLLLGIVLTLVALMTITPLFTALGAKSEVLNLVREYMRIWYLGAFCLAVSAIAMNTIRAIGDMKALSLIVVISTAINILLDPILIFGLLGFPNLGIAGAAIATVIAQLETLIAALLYLYHADLIIFTLHKLRGVGKAWIDILHLGIPSAAKNAIPPISLGLITSMVAFYGSEAIAAFGIASRLESLVMIAFFALSTAIGPVVGQNWGAKKFQRVDRAFSLSLRFCLFWGVLLAIILGFTASELASLFNNNLEVVEIVAKYMIIVPISYAAAGIILISSSTFIALGKPLPSITMAIAQTLLIYIPLAHLGNLLWGINGIFAAACLANIIVAIGAIIWQRQTLRGEFKILAQREATQRNSQLKV